MTFKRTTIPKVLITSLVIATCTSCSTNKSLNRKIATSLKLQNKIIIRIEKQRHLKSISSEIGRSKNLYDVEKKLLMGLKSIRKSNQVIINKLKLSNKGGNENE